MKKTDRLALRIDPTLKAWLREKARRSRQDMSKIVERGLILVQKEEVPVE